MNKKPRATKTAPRRKRTTGSAATKAAQKRGGGTEDENRPDQKAIDEHRERMQLVGELTNAAIDRLPEEPAESDRVGRGAYLHMIQQVFYTLQGLALALPLDAIARLSRIVVEQRRAELTKRKAEAECGVGTSSAANGETAEPLPASVRDVIQQVYGVTVDVESRSPDAPP